MEILHCVLCLISGGQEKHAVTGTTLFLPTDTEYVMKSECERKKMADKEEWEEMKQEACVSTGSSSFLLHPFTFLHRREKKKREKISGYVRVFVCVHLCVTSYPHKRFCILSALFILPFI